VEGLRCAAQSSRLQTCEDILWKLDFRGAWRPEGAADAWLRRRGELVAGAERDGANGDRQAGLEATRPGAAPAGR